MEELKESMKFGLLIGILYLLFRIGATLMVVYETATEIKTTVVEVKQNFIDNADVLAIESVDYIKQEYSEDGKLLFKEVVDSTKSNIIKILNK